MEMEKQKEFAGWIDEKHRIAWVISPYRKDNRTGVVPCVKKIKPRQRKSSALMQMFGM